MVASLSITGTGILHGLTSQRDVAMAEMHVMFERKDTILSERTRHSLGLGLLNPRSTKSKLFVLPLVMFAATRQ